MGSFIFIYLFIQDKSNNKNILIIIFVVFTCFCLLFEQLSTSYYLSISKSTEAPKPLISSSNSAVLEDDIFWTSLGINLNISFRSYSFSEERRLPSGHKRSNSVCFENGFLFFCVNFLGFLIKSHLITNIVGCDLLSCI